MKNKKHIIMWSVIAAAVIAPTVTTLLGNMGYQEEKERVAAEMKRLRDAIVIEQAKAHYSEQAIKNARSNQRGLADALVNMRTWLNQSRFDFMNRIEPPFRSNVRSTLTDFYSSQADLAEQELYRLFEPVIPALRDQVQEKAEKLECSVFGLDKGADTFKNTVAVNANLKKFVVFRELAKILTAKDEKDRQLVDVLNEIKLESLAMDDEEAKFKEPTGKNSPEYFVPRLLTVGLTTTNSQLPKVIYEFTNNQHLTFDLYAINYIGRSRAKGWGLVDVEMHFYLYDYKRFELE